MLGSVLRGSRTGWFGGALVVSLGSFCALGCQGDRDDTAQGSGGAAAGGAAAGGTAAGGLGPGGSDPGPGGALPASPGDDGAGGGMPDEPPGDWPFGATCKKDADCANAVVAGENVRLKCLKDFAGGLCSLGCSEKGECPSGALCVVGSTRNYCTPDCNDADNCNEHRSSAGLSTCSYEFYHADASSEASGQKACLPPADEE